MRAAASVLALLALTATAGAETCQRGDPVYASVTLLNSRKAELTLGPPILDKPRQPRSITITVGDKTERYYITSSNGAARDYAVRVDNEQISSPIFYFDRTQNLTTAEDAVMLFLPDLPVSRSQLDSSARPIGQTWHFQRCAEPVL